MVLSNSTGIGTLVSFIRTDKIKDMTNSGLYTIKHGKGFSSTGNSYRSNLEIVNKETLIYVAQWLGVEGVAKSHTKERMAATISDFVLSHPEECMKQLSVNELSLLSRKSGLIVL